MRNPLKTVQTAVAFARLAQDMGRRDEVFNLGEGLVAPEVLQAMADHVRSTPSGALALQELPGVHLDLARLATLPEGTLGRAYADFMIANRLDPEDMPTLVAFDEVRYVQAHLVETHHLWHVVTGFGTDVAGELGLQAFYLAQIPGRLPSAMLAAGFLNMLVHSFEDRDRRMRAIVRGWLLGKRSRPLFGVRWDDHLERPLDEVRRSLGLELDAVDAVLPADDTVEDLRAAA
jgi:ubiquinone biosynthesis protein Coq4